MAAFDTALLRGVFTGVGSLLTGSKAADAAAFFEVEDFTSASDVLREGEGWRSLRLRPFVDERFEALFRNVLSEGEEDGERGGGVEVCTAARSEFRIGLWEFEGIAATRLERLGAYGLHVSSIAPWRGAGGV